MSIATEISRLQTAKASIKSSLEAKGVTVPSETLLGGYSALVDSITSGGGEYSPPADWINIDDCALGNINLLVADTTLATYAFICTTSAGQYHVDWGDGTSNDYNSGTTAQHTYTIGSGQTCSRGYTTFKIVISPVAGNLTRFYVTSHNLTTQNQDHGYLACVFRATSVTSMANMFQATIGILVLSCRMLEMFKCTDTISSSLSATYAFTNCNSLKTINISTIQHINNTSHMFEACYSLTSTTVGDLSGVTVSSYMFNNCYCLLSVDLSTLSNVGDAARMFIGCYNLKTIDASAMINVTDASYMFYTCYNLKSANVSNMTKVTTSANMFANCYNLSSLTITNFASTAASTDANAMFDACQLLTNIDLSSAKVIRVGAKGAIGKLNRLETLTFHAESTFSNTTAPQIDLQYCTLSAAQIDTILTDLPTVTGKTITVKGCTGAATCTKSIAEAKGWTVLIA